MTALILAAIAALGADTADASAAPAGRKFHEIQRDISELFRREATAQDSAARASAVRGLCAVYTEIVRDPRLAESDALKDYKTRVWSRLNRVKGELKRELARQDRAAGEPEDEAAAQLADSLAATMSLADGALAGPALALARGGGAVPADYGRELVELIERTINPQFWDVNGGPGSIVYYAPLKCLVVRATGEIHGNLGKLLGGLRK